MLDIQIFFLKIDNFICIRNVVDCAVMQA